MIFARDFDCFSVSQCSLGATEDDEEPRPARLPAACLPVWAQRDLEKFLAGRTG